MNESIKFLALRNRQLDFCIGDDNLTLNSLFFAKYLCFVSKNSIFTPWLRKEPTWGIGDSYEDLEEANGSAKAGWKKILITEKILMSQITSKCSIFNEISLKIQFFLALWIRWERRYCERWNPAWWNRTRLWYVRVSKPLNFNFLTKFINLKCDELLLIFDKLTLNWICHLT